MLKLISAIMSAAAIAGTITLLTAASAPVDAGPLAKPAEAALNACVDQPWPYLHCVGTEFGNPRIRLVATNRLN
jgi:hypothetical protein